jgi:hypothetical protein
MKHQTKLTLLLVLFLAVFYSCKKRCNQPDFAGNYRGTVMRQGVSKPDSFSFSGTSNPDVFSFYNPVDSEYLTVTVSCNSIVSIDGGGSIYGGCSPDTISGFGSLSGNVLQYTTFDAYTCSGVSIVDTLSVIATKM